METLALFGTTLARLLFSLFYVKYIFFWFYGSFRLDGNNEYAEEVLRRAMECADVATFTFAT